ncbi:MAG: hypothetical protein ACFHX7_03925 [Pseudomonadota bacterium]
MKGRIANLVLAVNTRSLRERIFLVVVVMALTLVGFSEVLWTPAYNAYAADRKRLEQLAAASTTQLATLGALQRQAAVDPDAALHAENTRLTAELARREAALKARVAQLVAPDEVVDLLQAVLSATEGVSLVTLEHLSADRVFGDETPGSVALYRHRVRLVFDASYFPTIDYLRRLETPGMRLIFRELSYEVATHPLARVTLVVETLGMEKEWIGV